eukprot:TRINITY_DN51886_c0_g1_i1.p1 TRINITY_DN51886_c0_g1~~TRINITY_DN51886_c0_g1_i1.p1  ORF type:complete len:217 (+),score=13.29 TRINITY_DN51886_c0_g1_i1:44-694(+)
MGKLWPAADWDDWPVTRVGGLVFDLTVMLLVIIWMFLQQRAQGNSKDKSNPAETACWPTRYMWGFFPIGADVVQYAEGVLTFSKYRSFTTTHSHVNAVAVEGVSLGRFPFTVLNVFLALVLSCGFGLFLHFICCIWWTCDWSEHDGAGVRGGIWFITWGLTFVGMMVLTRAHCAVVTVTPQAGQDTKLFHLAGGQDTVQKILKITRTATQHDNETV